MENQNRVPAKKSEQELLEFFAQPAKKKYNFVLVPNKRPKKQK